MYDDGIIDRLSLVAQCVNVCTSVANIYISMFTKLHLPRWNILHQVVFTTMVLSIVYRSSRDHRSSSIELRTRLGD